MKAAELRQRVDRTGNLPSLPIVVSKILSTVDDPRASASQLNELVGQEPALATRMLRLANSAYFGRRNGIVSLRQCAVVLGFNTIRSLALSASIQKMMMQSGSQGFDLGAFWLHSLGAGVAGKVLARKCGADPEAAHSAGLVHDIGKLVMDVIAPTEYQKVQELMGGGADDLEAEGEVFGATHTEVGGWLAEKWRLPESISAAIQWHHQPERAGDHEQLAWAVKLADDLCAACAEGQAASSIDPEMWRRVNVSEGDLEGLEAEFRVEWKRAQEVMNPAAAEAQQAA